MRKLAAATGLAVVLLMTGGSGQPAYDLLIRDGEIYDGTGAGPVRGDVGVKGDRIVCVGVCPAGPAKKTLDARGQAVSPGFINMLSWSVDSLIQDGRGLSALKQGVTLEVMGEGSSMGPWNETQKADDIRRQGDIKYEVAWSTLDEYLRHLEARGVSLNVASFVGAETVRVHVLGEDDVDPTPEQLAQMRALVVKAMEDGAMGVGSSLIYASGNYAETDELWQQRQSAIRELEAARVAHAASTLPDNVAGVRFVERDGKLIAALYIPAAAAACISATCVRRGTASWRPSTS